MNPHFEQRVLYEIAEKRLWRAKEMLRGSLTDKQYDAERYELYGSVLLQMHDLMEAGRFLFISGARKQEYEHAISLFRERFAANEPKRLLRELPVRLLRMPTEQWPQAILRDLDGLGLLNDLSKYQAPFLVTPKSLRAFSLTTPLVQKCFSAGCLLVLAIALLCSCIGLITVVKWFTE